MDGSLRGAVVGAGRMGVGIGLVLARAGVSTTFLVRDEAQARRRLALAVTELRALGWVEAGAELAPNVVTTVAGLPGCDFIVESVSEDIDAKHAVLAAVSAAQPHALLGTNTSSLPISALAAAVHHPERFAATHFWYPPTLMPLVELVPGPDTAPESLDRWASLLARCGMNPVRLRREIPGFLWNRLQVAVLREAKHLVESGVADPASVDLVVQQGLARRWAVTGPLASAVLGGLGTFEAVGRNLLPLLSTTADLDGLADVVHGYVTDPAELDRYRNQRLAKTPPGPSPTARVAGFGIR